MAKFEVKNSEGKKVAEAELAAEVYGIEPNIHVMHHIVKCQMRQGTQSAKGRSEVSGGGKKPWRQKGTGRARQGSIRAAQWRHGGVVFAPKPRSYAKRMNNKEVKLAMRSALSAKLADGELVLVDDYGFEKPSTKAAVAMLKALGLEGKRLTIIVRDEDVNAYLSFRNIPKTFIITADEAKEIGLVNHVTEDTHEAVLAEAEKIARKIMEKGPVAIQMAKLAINMGCNVDMNTGLMIERLSQTIALSTEDRKEGTLAFLEKRPAQFKGR